MPLSRHSRAIGVFPSREAGGQALDHLILSGFPVGKVFLVGKDSAPNDQPDNVQRMIELVNQARVSAISQTAMGMINGLLIGNVSGGLVGLGLGLGILALPGVDQLAIANTVALTLLSSGICVAVAGAIGALIGLEMAEKQARLYSRRISCGNYLVIVNGTDDEIHRAESILSFQRKKIGT